MLKKPIIFIICAWLITSVACSNGEIISHKNNSNIRTEFSSDKIKKQENVNGEKKYSKEISQNLIADAVINDPKVTDIALLKAESIKFDSEKLCNIFFDSKNIFTKDEGGGITFIENSKSLTMVDDRTYFDFYTPLKSYVQGIINVNNLDRYDSNELNFMPKQEAINKASNLLKLIGINPNGEPDVYSFDYKTLQQEQDKSLREGLQSFVDLGKVKLKENWTKEDEFYYLLYRINIDGIPCDSLGYTQIPSGLPVNGSQMEVIISKNGFERLKVNGTIYQKVSINNGTYPIISVDQALNSVKKKYDNIILQNKAVVTDIDFIYTPSLIEPIIDSKTGAIISKQIDMIPAWLLKIKLQNNNGTSDEIKTRDTISYVRINAITGKEIL